MNTSIDSGCRHVEKRRRVEEEEDQVMDVSTKQCDVILGEEEDRDVPKTPCRVGELDSVTTKDQRALEEEVDTFSQATVRSLHKEKKEEQMELDTEDGGSSSSSEDSSEDSRLLSSSSQASAKSHKEGEVEEEENQMDEEVPGQTMVSSPPIARGHVDARLSSLEDAVSQKPDEVSQGQVVSSLEKTGSQEEEMDFENSQVEEVQNIQDEEVENREEGPVAADDQEEVVGEGTRRRSRRLQVAKERSQEEISSEEDEEYEEWREKEDEKRAQKEYEEQLKETASQRREKQRQIAAEMRDSESQEEPQGIPAKKKRGPKPKNTRKHFVSQEDQRLLELFKNDKVRFLYIHKEQNLSCFFQCPYCKRRMGKGINAAALTPLR